MSFNFYEIGMALLLTISFFSFLVVFSIGAGGVGGYWQVDNEMFEEENKTVRYSLCIVVISLVAFGVMYYFK